MSGTRVCDGGELRALVGACLGEGQVPERLIVAPWGNVESSSGGFVVDDEAGRLVIERFAAHGTDLPIDFEHQTLGGEYSSPNGKAPAAGWITELDVVPGEGIVALVNWTDDGRRLVGSKAYRYVSPVAMIRKEDRKLVALHSVALTNKPAIVGMTAIINRADGGVVEGSDCDGGDVDVVGDRDGGGADGDSGLMALREKLELAGDCGTDAVLAAAGARIASLEAESMRRDAEGLVAEAMSAGKLTEAQRDWAMTMATEHRSMFEEWAKTAPVVVMVGRTEPPKGLGGTGGSDEAARSAARSEYRSSELLQGLTSEEAYVAEAVRPDGD